MTPEYDHPIKLSEDEVSHEALLDVTHALIVPGQAGLTVGMGKELARRSEAADRIWQFTNSALRPLIHQDFTDIVWEGTPEELARNENSQPARITDALARRAALEESGQLDSPGVHAGLSLGFIAALVNAGSLSLDGAIFLVKGRREAFKHVQNGITPSTMMALVDVDEAMTEEVIERFKLVKCIINTDTNEVLGGEVPNIEAAAAYLQQEKGLEDQVFPLAIDAAYHSHFMEAAVPEYTKVVLSTPIDTPTNGALYGASSARQLFTREDIQNELISQLTQTERWRDTMKLIRSTGVATMTELNYVATLTNMNRDLFEGQRKRVAYSKRDDTEKDVVIAHRWLAPQD